MTTGASQPHAGSTPVPVPRPVSCPKCGHDLAGVDDTSVCPACWTAFEVARTVPRDLPCRRCGYNLRGLAESGSCPECGAPVAQSLRAPLLQYSDPEYVAMLHRGVLLVEVAVIVHALLRIGVIVGSVASAVGGGGSPSWIYWWDQSGSVGLTIVALAGWWMLTVPDPADAATDSGATARRVLRVTVAIGLIAAAGSLLTAVWTGNPAPTPGRGGGNAANIVVGTVMAAQLAASIAWIVQFFAAMKYLQRLGPRLPDRQMVVHAGRFMWLLPLLYVVGALCFGLGSLIAFVLYVSLLDQLRSRLRGIRRIIPPAAPA